MLFNHQSTFFMIDRPPPYPKPLNLIHVVSTSIAEVASKRLLESRHDNLCFDNTIKP